MLDLLSSGDLDTEEQHLIFDELNKNTGRTLELLDSLLMWAKSQSGTALDVDMKKIPVCQVLEEAEAYSRLLSEKKKCS